MPTASREPKDTVLVRQSLQGSREAFGLLVVRYSRSVRALCLARLGVCNDLDDLVQDTFLRAFKGLAQLKERAKFGGYVHRIARNVCVDWLRRNRRQLLSLDAADSPIELGIPADGQVDLREERLEHLRLLVGRLPLALREAVLLFYFERRSYAEIAAFLEITEAAVNQRLHRARVTLRSSMDVEVEPS